MNMVDMDDDDDDTTETQHRQYPQNLNPSSSSDHHHKDDTDSNGTKPRNQTSAYRPTPTPAAVVAPPSMKINARIGSYAAADSEEDEEDENNNDHDDSEDDDGNDNDNGDDDEEEDDDDDEEEEEEDDEDGTSMLPPSFRLAAAETRKGDVPSSQKRKKKKKRREYAVEGIARGMKTPKPEPTEDLEEEEEDDDDEGSRGKRMFQKRKPLSAFGPSSGNGGVETSSSKKPKKKYNNSWTRSGSRRWCRRAKSNGNGGNHSAGAAGGAAPPDETVAISPVLRFPDDASDMKICLSKVYKAEKVELSDDRMTAGSCKGFRMVRATRGVSEGTWFFEIKVAFLGPTGHTRLGWTTEKGDLQAPVGYDANSYGYRDIDGTKIHKALREKYGEEGYKEGDIIGCYVSLPEGSQYAPKPPRFVWHRGQRYVLAPDKDEEPKIVPDSKIIFFKNGVSQGVAFTELTGERYYPAASMYTLPNQPNCLVRFNFGPDFECFPQDFGGHPSPKPMIDAPYCGFDGEASTNDASVENPPAQQNDQSEKKV